MQLMCCINPSFMLDLEAVMLMHLTCWTFCWVAVNMVNGFKNTRLLVLGESMIKLVKIFNQQTRKGWRIYRICERMFQFSLIYTDRFHSANLKWF